MNMAMVQPGPVSWSPAFAASALSRSSPPGCSCSRLQLRKTSTLLIRGLHGKRQYSCVAVYPRTNGCVHLMLGKRLPRSFAVPTEGENFALEASTSSDSAGNVREEDIESTSDQPFFQDVQIDLNLPRRRLLVEFTCKVCDTRTQRVINPEAYRRGTVFVQCAGCDAYHQLVDNLNLIEEFDFREENGSNGK